MSNLIEQDPVVTVTCPEPDGEVEHKVYPLIFTPENLEKLYLHVKKFPTVFGKQYLNFSDFMSLFFTFIPETGDVTSKGIFYVVDDFTGVFYVTDIIWPYDALVHYSFFDRRHNGRVPLVKAMLEHLFAKYGFYRLSAEIPNYASPGVRRFTEQCGFSLEGKRRQCVDYKGQRFDVNLYGILDKEAR